MVEPFNLTQELLKAGLTDPCPKCGKGINIGVNCFHCNKCDWRKCQDTIDKIRQRFKKVR